MDNPASKALCLLRVFVLLLLAGMCYQLGYKSGFDAGEYDRYRRQAWEALERSEGTATLSEDAAPSETRPVAAIPCEVDGNEAS